MPNKLQILERVQLADLTTFKIGGEARFFVEAKTVKEVLAAIDFAENQNIDVFILGGGSNVLISDEGFKGLVLQIGLRDVSIFEEDNSTVYVTAEAGEDWDEFVGFCVAKNFAGLECLSGIPGFVGGTPIQNVGAYGQEVSESIVSVKVFDRHEKKLKTFTNADCGFKYRESRFNSGEKDRYIVLAVTYALKPDGEPKIVYDDLKKCFLDRSPTLRETRDAVCEIRREKGMLVRQGGLDAQSAGSFFKNPVISNEAFDQLLQIARVNDFGKLREYWVDDDRVKIPAAWLIEKAGFQNGFRKGNVGLSTKHTLALTNRGNAKASELIALKEIIQHGVKEKFGVELIPEPKLIGFTRSLPNCKKH